MGKASEKLQQLFGRLKKPRNYRLILALALLVIGGYLFTGYIVTAALVISVGTVAWTVNKIHMKQIGVELATFSTVLIGAAYGQVPGAFMGISLILLQVTAGQYKGSYLTWVIPAYPVAGFIAGALGGVEIFLLGAGLTVGMQAVFAILTSVTSMGSFPKYFPYAATNVVFNVLMFQTVAPVLLPLMT